MEEDRFAATKLFNCGYSYTYDDVIFLPHYIDFSTDDISLSTCRVPLFSLILSSPMDIVIEGAMAAAMASLGGLGIVYSNLSTVDQASVVLSVKSRHVPILSAPTFCAVSNRIYSLDDFDSCPYVLVNQSGSMSSQLLDYVSRSDWLQGVEEFVVIWIKNNEQHKVQKLEGKIIFLCLTKNLKIKPLSSQNVQPVKM
jgi:IMP dehydrogenase